jgi:hypothetical protein
MSKRVDIYTAVKKCSHFKNRVPRCAILLFEWGFSSWHVVLLIEAKYVTNPLRWDLIFFSVFETLTQHVLLIEGRDWWSGKNHYTMPNVVICIKKWFFFTCTSYCFWRRHLWHKTTPILHNIQTKHNSVEINSITAELSSWNPAKSLNYF